VPLTAAESGLTGGRRVSRPTGPRTRGRGSFDSALRPSLDLEMAGRPSVEMSAEGATALSTEGLHQPFTHGLG